MDRLGGLSGLIADLQSNELVGTTAIAARLKVTPGEIRAWVAGGILPAHRVSGRLVFRLADIIKWQIDGLERLAGPAEFGGDPPGPGGIT